MAMIGAGVSGRSSVGKFFPLANSLPSKVMSYRSKYGLESLKGRLEFDGDRQPYLNACLEL